MDRAYRKDLVPELDGLRAIAVLLVLWVHLPNGALGDSVEAFRRAVLPGNVGVDLFFVLSGFLITRILLVDRGAGVPLRHFLVRRFLRIFPIYYLTIAVLATTLPWQDVLACATYTANFAFLFKEGVGPLEHTWSLAIEEHFYLLWPPVVAFLAPAVSRRVLLFAVLPLAILSGALAFTLADWTARGPQWLEFMVRASNVRCFSLGLGALVAYHERWLRANRWPALAVAAGSAALCWATSLGGLEALGAGKPLARFFEERGHSWVVPSQAIHVYSVPFGSLAAVLAAVVFTGSRAPHAVLLRWAPLRAIGRVSYGVYLYHFPIFLGGAFAAGGEPQPLRVAAVVGLCFGAAAVSYRVVEKPILDVAKRFRSPDPSVPWSSPFTPAGWVALAAFVPALAWLLRSGAARSVQRLFGA